MQKGIIFVFIQFILLFLIFTTGPNIPDNIFLLLMFAVGIFIGLYAFWNMRISKLRTTPEVANGSRLVTTGIYKYIRHPMYLGLILIALSLLLDYFTFIRLAFFVLLVLNQIYKLNYEEGLLKKAFKNYDQYSKKSWRLIPFVY